ncbi:hypothetical protein D3C85_1056950 [compost metagenome]
MRGLVAQQRFGRPQRFGRQHHFLHGGQRGQRGGLDMAAAVARHQQAQTVRARRDQTHGGDHDVAFNGAPGPGIAQVLAGGFQALQVTRQQGHALFGIDQDGLDQFGLHGTLLENRGCGPRSMLLPSGGSRGRGRGGSRGMVVADIPGMTVAEIQGMVVGWVKRGRAAPRTPSSIARNPSIGAGYITNAA